jgi:hypothetical protein
MSMKRAILCSRENAARLAAAKVDAGEGDMAIIHTGEAFQPYRIVPCHTLARQAALANVAIEVRG